MCRSTNEPTSHILINCVTHIWINLIEDWSENLIFQTLQLTEAGAPGAPGVPVHARGSKEDLGPVMIQNLNTEVKPVQD